MFAGETLDPVAAAFLVSGNEGLGPAPGKPVGGVGGGLQPAEGFPSQLAVQAPVSMSPSALELGGRFDAGFLERFPAWIQVEAGARICLDLVLMVRFWIVDRAWREMGWGPRSADFAAWVCFPGYKKCGVGHGHGWGLSEQGCPLFGHGIGDAGECGGSFV